jgi:hypothetical protein
MSVTKCPVDFLSKTEKYVIPAHKNKKECEAMKKPKDPFFVAVTKTAKMVRDSNVTKLFHDQKLTVTNVSWEDTSRFKNSSYGNNITDATLQVTYNEEKFLMPVVRNPNYSDKTGDISPDKFFVRVGNHKSKDKNDLQIISLTELLKNWKQYLSNSASVDPQSDASLYDAKVDTHVLVSAQACFMPVPESPALPDGQTKKAEFVPTAYNYQSYSEDPAVLLILATPEGSSVTIAGRFGDQNQLFFNEAGKRASFTAQRKKEYMATEEERISKITNDNERKEAHAKLAAEQSSLNLVLLIQVPLKQKPKMHMRCAFNSFGSKSKSVKKGSMSFQNFSTEDECLESCQEDADTTDDAVVSHGEAKDPFLECDNLKITRDTSAPIRVTVQFYSATATGVVTKETVSQIANHIAKVYEKSDFVGSLVTEGQTGRPTELVNIS